MDGFLAFLGPLQPSRRRSLFTLATSMILFLSEAYNFRPLVTSAKAALTDKTVGELALTCGLFPPAGF